MTEIFSVVQGTTVFYLQNAEGKTSCAIVAQAPTAPATALQIYAVGEERRFRGWGEGRQNNPDSNEQALETALETWAKDNGYTQITAPNTEFFRSLGYANVAGSAELSKTLS